MGDIHMHQKITQPHDVIGMHHRGPMLSAIGEEHHAVQQHFDDANVAISAVWAKNAGWVNNKDTQVIPVIIPRSDFPAPLLGKGIRIRRIRLFLLGNRILGTFLRNLVVAIDSHAADMDDPFEIIFQGSSTDIFCSIRIDPHQIIRGCRMMEKRTDVMQVFSAFDYPFQGRRIGEIGRHKLQLAAFPFFLMRFQPRWLSDIRCPHPFFMGEQVLHHLRADKAGGARNNVLGRLIIGLDEHHAMRRTAILN